VTDGNAYLCLTFSLFILLRDINIGLTTKSHDPAWNIVKFLKEALFLKYVKNWDGCRTTKNLFILFFW